MSSLIVLFGVSSDRRGCRGLCACIFSFHLLLPINRVQINLLVGELYSSLLSTLLTASSCSSMRLSSGAQEFRFELTSLLHFSLLRFSLSLPS